MPYRVCEGGETDGAGLEAGAGVQVCAEGTRERRGRRIGEAGGFTKLLCLPHHLFVIATPSLHAHHTSLFARGFGLQLGRTGGVMTTYFVTVDAIR